MDAWMTDRERGRQAGKLERWMEIKMGGRVQQRGEGNGEEKQGGQARRLAQRWGEEEKSRKSVKTAGVIAQRPCHFHKMPSVMSSNLSSASKRNRIPTHLWNGRAKGVSWSEQEEKSTWKKLENRKAATLSCRPYVREACVGLQVVRGQFWIASDNSSRWSWLLNSCTESEAWGYSRSLT